MAIATEEQIAQINARVEESEARSIKERLRDPKTHSPVKLRADALQRIEELEDALHHAAKYVPEGDDKKRFLRTAYKGDD